MELGAPAQKDARLEMTQLRDVLYVLQLFEVTQFLAENATCPPPFYSVRVANYWQAPKWRFLRQKAPHF